VGTQNGTRFTSPVWRSEFVDSALGCYTNFCNTCVQPVTQFQYHSLKSYVVTGLILPQYLQHTPSNCKFYLHYSQTADPSALQSTCRFICTTVNLQIYLHYSQPAYLFALQSTCRSICTTVKLQDSLHYSQTADLFALVNLQIYLHYKLQIYLH